MRFVSDSQRKACFANMNRFSLVETPLSAVSEGLKQGGTGPPVSFSLKDDVRKLVALGDFDINPYAQAYLDALEEADVMGGEQAVRTQALYIANNLNAMNMEQEKYLDQLLSIGYNKPYTSKLEDPNMMSEVAFERLVGAFTEFSYDKQDLSGKIGLDVFRTFAEKRGIPFDWALVSNDWTDDMLTSEANAAIKDAWTRVKIRGINA